VLFFEVYTHTIKDYSVLSVVETLTEHLFHCYQSFRAYVHGVF
jgi:hypothetical protein